MSALLCLGAALALPQEASAQGMLERHFGSDEATKKNAGLVWELLGPGSHFDVHAGLWFANLSKGPLWGMKAAMGDDETSDDLLSPTDASRKIGRGRGTLRQVGLELAVKGNEAFFDYVSDKIFAAAQDEVKSRVENQTIEEGLLMILGEFRPDLKSWLGPDKRAYLQATYGRFDGKIDDARYFLSRNSVPYFGGTSSPWSTRYFSLDAGFFYGEDRRTRRAKGRSEWEDSFAYGFFGRYVNFSMPSVISPQVGAGGRGDLALQDVGVNSLSAGMRVSYTTCKVVCFAFETSFVPFTGLGVLGYGRWGNLYALTFFGSGDAGITLPIPLGGLMTLRPYASFRAEWMSFLNPSTQLAGSESNGLIEATVPTDFLIWGPRAGLVLQL
ncbi:MAG: hypothetical protein MUF64_05330 [Polyangiaceae bacterium]|nr:hypothetical protein [Polyangiaceae bacterium]